MLCPKNIPSALYFAVVLLTAFAETSRSDDSTNLRKQVELLQQQNAELQKQLTEQRSLIEGLTHKVAEIQQTTSQDKEESYDEPAASPAGFGFGKVHISGEGGIGIFDTGRKGTFPNSEFRVDEAKLFVEAPIWGDVYFYSEVNFAQRESDGLEIQLGELYVDFEDVSQLWGPDRMLNVRVGRMDIPFGEEYIGRDAIDNPLISHSLTDFWGVDEGLELYGSVGKFSYVVAVQNGGISGTRDFNSDKSVTARIGFDPTHWLHTSVSAMRTGDLDANDDYLSELWFGSGWFRSIGSTNATTFDAELLQGDVVVRLPHGHLKASGGVARYDDNDSTANNRRCIYFYSAEVLHQFTRKFYAAARFSQIFADDGYPIVGYGDFNDYFYRTFTTEIWRLSVGAGYRFSNQLVLKAEYTREQGRGNGGSSRDENFLAAEVAFKF